MNFQYQNELKLVNFLIDRLECRLAGRDEERIVNRVPIDHCRLGILVPSEPRESHFESAEGDLNEEIVESREPPISRRLPSALGMEILVQPNKGKVELEVEVDFAIYTRHLPTYEEQRQAFGDSFENTLSSGGMTLAEVCQRWTVHAGPVRFQIPADQHIRKDDGGIIQEELNKILNQALSRQDAMSDFGQQPKVPSDILSDEGRFRQWLNSISRGRSTKRPPLQAALEVYGDPQPDGTIRIRVYVRNNTPSNPVKRSEDHYHILGDVRLTVCLRCGDLRPIEILPVPEDYQYDRRVWAVGHNTSVEVREDQKTIRTHALARYEQPRMIMRTSDDTRFQVLASNPIKALERIRQEMEQYAKTWKSFIETNDLDLNEEDLIACRQDLKQFQEEINRFAGGIAAMIADPHLLKAFKGMNRVMQRVARGFDQWRLFQIVFIVSQLPALAIREGHKEGEWPRGKRHHWSEHLEVADVLWVRTGGGKTEAYLGLISCAILYDRLRGKKFGVTAWLRLPLRMLSLQQLQRALQVIWETEKERRVLLGSKVEQTDPVRLGYFVGSTQTPNIVTRDFLARLTPEDLERYRVVPNCPACGGNNTVKIEKDHEALRLRHKCTSCGIELPLLVCDSEIYRYLPSLIVGTVDKIATIGLQRRFGILFQGPEWKCMHGYGRGDWCDLRCKPRERIKVQPYDPSPSLHIQDELHLLQEELGAFAGHYETMIRFLEENISGFPAKVIAATATIEGFEHQVRHLYGVRKARRFPVRGYQRYQSFYTSLEQEGEEVLLQRIFVGFRSTSGHRSDLAAWCATALLETVAELLQNPYTALAVLQDLPDEEAVRQLLEYYNIALIYVGSLPSGTRVMDNLSRSTSAHLATRKIINAEYLHSRSTPAKITDVIRRADHPPRWEDPNHLDTVIATKMISHGIDFERINLMILDHFPGDVSEYIQATSRCGRKHLGLVVTLLPGYSLRASSIYNRFREFHDHLDRMVQPVPVNRFASRAVERTFPGIFSGLLLNKNGIEKRHQVLPFLQDKEMREQMIALLLRAYGLGCEIYDKDLEQMMENLVKEALQKQELVIKTSHAQYLREALRPSPMRSLRDVETGVPFHLSPRVDDRLLRWLEPVKEKQYE